MHVHSPMVEIRRTLRTAGLAAAALALTACAAAPPAPAELVLTRPIVLLGEVHDNAAQHDLRLRAVEDWIARGARPALLMEQFDREQQTAIDQLRAQRPQPDAKALIAAAAPARGGWNWAFYQPFVALALRYDLPLVAVNVSRDDARAVMSRGLAASGLDAAVPADVSAGIVRLVQDSHCGMIDAAAARRLALAQVARDQTMARAVEANAARGVLLLAGNGHVRTDVGVPRWLSPATRARSEAIGLLELGDDDEAAAFDVAVVTPRQPREDPCAAMRRPAGVSTPASGAASPR